MSDKKKISVDHSSFLRPIAILTRRYHDSAKDLFARSKGGTASVRFESNQKKKKRATNALSHLATSSLNRPVGFCKKSVEKFQEISLHGRTGGGKKERKSGFLILVLNTCVSTCERNVEREREKKSVCTFLVNVLS